MIEQLERIQNFTDLRTWQEGHTLVLSIYSTTKHFPKEETYSLIDQMRRAATSITSNIAEGFGRRTGKERIHFYYIAHGSLTELKNQLIIAKDVGYLPQEAFVAIMGQADTTHRLLNGLLVKTKQLSYE